ncbi:hypothetical protein Godav_011927, partial [Gossypium davidsonii]|nr:hypothetical protein [Gossypium davidsonii]
LEVQTSSNSTLIRRIHHLLLNVGSWAIQHIPRHRNKVIDWLVKMVFDTNRRLSISSLMVDKYDGLVLVVLIASFGITGYSLPWDQIGYWAEKIVTGVSEAILVKGSPLKANLRAPSPKTAEVVTSNEKWPEAERFTLLSSHFREDFENFRPGISFRRVKIVKGGFLLFSSHRVRRGRPPVPDPRPVPGEGEKD